MSVFICSCRKYLAELTKWSPLFAQGPSASSRLPVETDCHPAQVVGILNLGEVRNISGLENVTPVFTFTIKHRAIWTRGVKLWCSWQRVGCCSEALMDASRSRIAGTWSQTYTQLYISIKAPFQDPRWVPLVGDTRPRNAQGVFRTFNAWIFSSRS